MTRSKMQPRWSMLAILGLAVGSGYWMFAGGCAPSSGGGGGGGSGAQADEPGGGGTDEPDGQGGTDEPVVVGDTENLTIVESSCVALDDQAGGVEIKVEGVSKGGKQLTFTRRVITALGDKSFRIETEVMSDGELVLMTVTTASATSVKSTIEYGPAVTDEETATEIVLEDGMITGVVAGRAIVPTPKDELDPNNVEFEDGNPEQEMDVDADLEAAVTDLYAAAMQVADGCQVEVTDGDGGDQVALQSTRQPVQDTGHSSSPRVSGPCAGCWAACSVAVAGCVGGGSAGCAAAFICWPCVAACEVVVVAACALTYVGCLELCEMTGGPCCPVACGDVACCDGGETCLNSAIGICCSSGKTPCVGKACCPATQSCIQTGPNAGTCCPAIDICGNTCCNPTDSCIEAQSLCCSSDRAPCDTVCCPSGQTCLGDGLCCDPDLICGDACCGELDNCTESLSLCCGFAQQECDGACCDVGETCVAGDTCCANALACGNFCCSQGTFCDSNTLTCIGCPNATDTACDVGGCCPAGMNCTDNEGTCCPQGETVCNPSSTTCVPLNDCLF